MLANIKLFSTSATPNKLFKLLDGSVDASCSTFRDKAARYNELEARYKSLLTAATAGGGEKAVSKHTQNDAKIVAWERVKRLLDPGTDFLEVSPLAGMDMPYGSIPRASMVTGTIFFILSIKAQYSL